jgi:hypothetical protein
MIVDDLDQLGAGVAPDEADAQLVINPDAVLTATVTLEGLQAITGGRPKIGNPGCGIENVELAQRDRSDRLELGNCFTLEQGLGPLVPERPDHPKQI